MSWAHVRMDSAHTVDEPGPDRYLSARRNDRARPACWVGV